MDFPPVPDHPCLECGHYAWTMLVSEDGAMCYCTACATPAPQTTMRGAAEMAEWLTGLRRWPELRI